MVNQPKSIARLITKFSPLEIRSLFKKSITVLEKPGIQMRRVAADAGFNRILIVIPRAVGTAVERNLLRRRIKSIFYTDALYKTGFDLLLLTQKGATNYSFEELRMFLHKAVEDNK